ncbi:MAG: hypothetical protein IKZ58_02995 [Selenomonadaceae bacterium]|nr:hypothetical protein [Selenomonadaceae bacterium]
MKNSLSESENDLNELIHKYCETFGEGLPYMVGDWLDEEIEELVKNCLESGKPYELDEETKKLMANPKVDF